MANVTFDKKQLPQVAALGTLSACMFGYFGFKMLAPPATQAAPPAPASPATGTAGTASAATAASGGSSALGSGSNAGDATVDPSALIGAPAPSPAMRDPFAAPSAAKAATSAASDSTPRVLPSLAALAAPRAQEPASTGEGIQQLPRAGAPGIAPQIPSQVVSPAAQWGVSGVICSDINPALSLAIFRAGSVRRYVRVGEWLDDATQLVSLDRTGVELARSGMRFRLTIGATPSVAPGQQPAATTAPPASLPSPSPQQPAPPQQHAELLPQPAQAYPVVTIASAAESSSGIGEAQQAPIEKVAASVQVTPATPGAAPAQPTDADSPATGAMDVPTFNSDLPSSSSASLLKPAAWASQAGMPPTESVLLTPDRNQALPASAALPSPVTATVADTQPAQPSDGLGMKLISTPTSVLQALGIDSALFAPQDASAAPNFDQISGIGAPSIPSPDIFGDTTEAAATPTSDSASIFEQYDAATSADMTQIACIDNSAQATVVADAPVIDQQADSSALHGWSAAFQQDVQQLIQEFTS